MGYAQFGLIFTVRYWNRGHPDNEIQSESRTETVDSNIFKSSQSNVQKQWNLNLFVDVPVMFTRLRCWLNAKLKPVVLSRACGFRKELHAALSLF